MYLRDFFALKPFHDHNLCSVLPQPTLYSHSAVYISFTHSLHFIPGPQSAVRSPQSTVHSLRLAPTDKKVNFEFGFKLQAQQIIMLL